MSLRKKEHPSSCSCEDAMNALEAAWRNLNTLERLVVVGAFFVPALWLSYEVGAFVGSVV